MAGVDTDSLNVQAHRKNFPDCLVLKGALADTSARELLAAAGLSSGPDVVVGGPPCQGFSLIGKRQTTDVRNSVLLDFARLAADLNPSYIVAENVVGLTVGKALSFLERYRQILADAGFETQDPWLLNAADFGAPQNRRRVFLVSHKRGLSSPTVPSATSSEYPPTVWDAIGDLDVVTADVLGEAGIYEGELGLASTYAAKLRVRPIEMPKLKSVNELTGCLLPTHSDEIRARFDKTPEGSREPISQFSRLSRTGQSTTIRAGTGSDRGSYMAARPIHPTRPRCITPREAARLHGFPDWFEFHGTRWHAFRQIGNAVPPPLGEAVARALRGCIQ
jgi:DNA (cytosine-5)-methyltransferase 1